MRDIIRINAISDAYSSDILVFSKRALIRYFKKLCWKKIHIEIAKNEINEYFSRLVKKFNIK